MSIYQLKSSFQNLLRPISNGLAISGVTANQITITALILSAVQGTLIALFPQSGWPLILLPFTLLIRMALNAIDGMVAREHHQQSALGAFLNELGDVISDALLYLPFALIPAAPAALIIGFVFLSTLSEMTGVTALMVGSDRRYNGPMGKSDRAFVMGALGLALGCGLPYSTWSIVLFSALNLLLILTIKNRIKSSLEQTS